MRTIVTIVSVLVCAHAVLGSSDRSEAAHARLQWQWWNWIWGTDINKAAAEKVLFELYTRDNADDPELVTASGLPVNLVFFDPARPTKVIIHGWHSTLGRLLELKDAILLVDDVNVVVVDWRKLDTILYPLVTVQRIKPIARQVAAFLDFLESRGYASPEKLHLIGHSLGAHIAGLSTLYRSSKATIARITGLDPAGLLISDNPEHRLDKTHAAFVDVIHTCGNVLGYPHAIGHVDFFPNGGTCPQPGCMLKDLTIGKCSHIRAFHLFHETILDGESMMALPAHTQSDKSTSPCKTVNYSGEKVAMGMATPSSARGQYCLSTKPEEPFGYGQDVVIHEAHELSSHHADMMKRNFLVTSA